MIGVVLEEAVDHPAEGDAGAQGGVAVEGAARVVEDLFRAAGQILDQPTFHERYEAMPPSTRAELVGGVVQMPSPLRSDHGRGSYVCIAFF